MPVQRETTWAIRSGVTTSCAMAPPLPSSSSTAFSFDFEIGDDAVSELAGAGEVAPPLRLLELDAGLVELLLQLLRRGELLLLLLPAARKRIRLLLEIDDLLLELGKPVLGGRVLLFLQRLALDLELHDAPVELIEFLGL